MPCTTMNDTTTAERNSTTSLATVDGPSIAIDLAEPILALAVNLAAVASLWQPTAIAQPLNVLPFAAAPLVTKAALIQMPHVDLDVASKVGNVDLLRLMHRWSKQPGGRPAHYNGDISTMMKQGNLDVLNWWIRESGLVLEWYDGFEGVFEHGHVHVLEWWRELGFPHLAELQLRWCLDYASASNNGVCVLDWCAESLPANAFKSAVEEMTASVWTGFCTFARDGNLDVLQWWLDKAQQVDWMDMSTAFASVIRGAFRGKQLAVLKWCKEHIQGIELRSKHALELAVEGPYFAWIDSLGVKVSQDEFEPATMAACASGNVDALVWLKHKGCLSGSWTEMMVHVIDSDELKESGGDGVEASMQVLDWIHKQTRLSECPAVSPIGGGDPYLTACCMGREDVLDCLFLNKYPMRDLESSLGAYFDGASRHGHVCVLDWLVSHVDSSDVDYFDVAFSCALATASRAKSIAALDWWWDKLANFGALAALTSSEYAYDDGTIDISRMVCDCDDGAIDIVHWWMQKNQEPGLLKDCLDVGDAYLHACFKGEHMPQPVPQPNCVAILREFLNAGVEMDFASCIYLASTNGKLDVLDWLLKEAKAPLEAFLNAFNPADEFKYYDLLSDCNAHQRTHNGSALLWWRCNVPQVRGVTLTKSPANELFNPINVHLLGAVLKVQGIPWPSMWSLRGRYAMLYYLRDRGILTEAGLDVDKDKNWSLEKELIEISSEEPSMLCAALEWWQSSFPEKFACPAVIASGNTPISGKAKKWWLRSGLLCGAGSKVASFD